MTIYERVIKALEPLNITVSTLEHFTDKGVTDNFIVIVPENDNIDYADDKPIAFTENAELQLYCKGNYIGFRDKVTNALISADITITSRQYLEYEQDLDFHCYSIGVAAE